MLQSFVQLSMALLLLWVCLLRLCSVSFRTLLLCSSVEQRGPEEDVGFTQEVPKTVGLRGLCVTLTVFNLSETQTDCK